jgi:hypothetical protein
MNRGTVELEPEVLDRLENLPDGQFEFAAFYIDLLADQGPLLRGPYTRQLDGKVRELRIYLFRKTRTREEREVQRARRARRRCVAQQHTPDEDDGSDTDG